MASPLDTYRDEEEKLSSSVERGPRTEAAITVLRGDIPGALFPLRGEEIIIGRDPDLAITLPEHSLSRRHARVRRLGSAYMVEDLGSTNGTFVDGERISGPRALEDGSRVHLGTRTVLHFRLYDKVELEAACATYALTVRDSLTGLFNRRYLQDRLWSEAAYSKRHHAPLSLILLDVDHFKRINDQHGHSVGDAALRMLASALSELTRQEDVLARYGGEEFALIARGIDREKTLALAERIRRSIERQRLSIAGGSLGLTVSIGIAHTDTGDIARAEELFEAADRALYSAKDAGRNLVSIAPTRALE
ncbi:MAG TPA: GGDEF domain-containing protein [Polyangiales bacterium]|nr:GGDEF domain-containing protein [Polyangiales bacterium]